MPLYEYLCDSCHQRVEILQKLGDDPETVCPNCGGALRKMISAPAFQFKGTGWYQTDYAKRSGSESGSGKNDEKSGSADAAPAAPAAGEGAAPSTTPPAPAAATKPVKPAATKASD